MTKNWMYRLSAEDKQTLILPMQSGRLLDAAPVLITVTAANHTQEKASLTTRGLLASMEDCWGLCFHEAFVEEPSEVFTYVECKADCVTITRIGDTVSTIVHQRENTYINSHDDDIGAITTRIFTNDVLIKRRGRTGQIHISYQFNLSGVLAPTPDIGARQLSLRFRPCK